MVVEVFRLNGGRRLRFRQGSFQVALSQIQRRQAETHEGVARIGLGRRFEFFQGLLKLPFAEQQMADHEVR